MKGVLFKSVNCRAFVLFLFLFFSIFVDGRHILAQNQPPANNAKSSPALEKIEVVKIAPVLEKVEVVKPQPTSALSGNPQSLFAPDHPGNKTQEEAKKQAEKNGVKFLNVKPEGKQPAKSENIQVEGNQP